MKVEDGRGLAKFWKLGLDYEELRDGVGTYTSAIIEREDGTIENVPVEMIKFVEVCDGS